MDRLDATRGVDVSAHRLRHSFAHRLRHSLEVASSTDVDGVVGKH